MSGINSNDLSSTSRDKSKSLNVSQTKKETDINTYKTNANFDTDKSLINIPKQMKTNSNDLNIVNSYSISHSVASNKSEILTEESLRKQTFNERTIYEEINQAENNIENME
jgi:hypothetical protein